MVKVQKIKGTVIYVILLSLSIGLYLYRLKWGMADVDESFYLSIPFRLLQGDALLVDEWNLSQLSAVLQYPLLAIYLKMFKSTEGIIVAFRLIYVMFQSLVSVFTYIMLKKKDEVAAVIIAILFFLFTPFNIMALSYNTMGLMSVWIVSVLLYSCKKEAVVPNVVSGMFFSFAVLCNPFMAIAYFGYTIYMLCDYIWCKRKDSLKRWLYLTGGIGIVFIIFAIFVFSRTSIEQIVENLAMVLTSPAHGSKGIFELLLPFINFFKEFKWYTMSVGCLFVLGICRKDWRNSCFYLSAAVSMIQVTKFALTLTNLQGYATIMIPLTPLGAMAFCYSDEKDWEILFWWITGVVYAFFMNMASNNGIYVIANGCTVSSLASILMIVQFLNGRTDRKAGVAVFVIMVLVQLLSQVFICANHVFWEEGPKALSSEIQDGPLKGIKTTQEKADAYQATYEHLDFIKQNYDIQDKYGLLFKKNPWGYLVLDEMRMGAYSAWMSDIAETVDDERIQKYYEFHPEKYPEMIYVDAESAEVWKHEQWKEYAKENDYRISEFSNGAYLMMKNNNGEKR